MCFDLEGFGAQVAAIRRERNMTQEELAERAALSPHYVGNIEQGVRRPSLTSIMQLCTALGATPDQLFKDSISREMLEGISVAVNSATTLRETMDVLTVMLSDLLPLEDEETPMLFGVPVHMIPKVEEPPRPTTLTDELLRLYHFLEDNPS